MRTALRTTVLCLALLLCATPALAAPPSGWGDASDVERRVSGEPHLGYKVYDAVLLRPLGFLQLAIGAVVFVPSYPVSLLFDGDEDVLRACITDPARRTFQRPLGQL